MKFTNNKTTLSALAIAAAMIPAQSAFAELTFANDNGLETYFHLATEAEYNIDSLDPSDKNSQDFWDNEVELGFGGSYGNWDFVGSFEFDTLADDDLSKIGDAESSREAELEIRDAYVEYEDGFMVRAGRWNQKFGTNIFYDEHTVGAMAGGSFGIVDLSAGVGTDTEADNGANEFGDQFGEDKTIAWVGAELGDFYAFNALHTDGADKDREGSGLGNLYNFGLGWDGTLGIVDLELEGNMQYGEDGAGRDYKGYAFVGFAKFDLGSLAPLVTVAYGSGDDDPDDNDVGLYSAEEADYKPDIVLINEALSNATDNTGLDEESIGNLLFVQVANEFEINDVWTLTPAVGYYQLAEENVNGDKDLGMEFDVFNSWEVNPYVEPFVNVGYVASGDALGDEDIYRVEIGARMDF